MTLFRLYVENGHRAGFWVQHRSWTDRCAQVRSIGGRTCGALPGAAPLHDNAEATIESFDVRSGRKIDAPLIEAPSDKNFARIAEPPWYLPSRGSC